MVDTRKLLGIMAERGITQKELARKMHRSENTISAKIRGIKPFDTDEVLEICLSMVSEMKWKKNKSFRILRQKYFQTKYIKRN